MAVKSRREEYAALTRAALLEAASGLFAEKGFDATSIDDLAAAARVSKGAVYHHFADKRAIFDEVFRVAQREAIEQVLTEALAGAGANGTPWDVASEAVRAFLRGYVADENKRSLLRQSAEVLGVRRCREIDEELALPHMKGLLETVRARGELQPVALDATAVVVFGTLCEAATSVAFARNPTETCQEMSVVVGHMLDGLRKAPD
ncbi:TetR/AcrR family transcriptional regulator [Streptomyces sp. NPDC057654]|uniref:TetR/AcrR family transcriptional regulator n=1 Tax=Streptomyces sp. NPDC057654 TaxID=3346196 RepID=UPI0036BCA0D2